MKDILERLADSHSNEGSHDLQCRCFDAAEEITRLRVQRDELLAALDDLIAQAEHAHWGPEDLAMAYAARAKTAPVKPRCYNRPPFATALSVPDGWSIAGLRVWRVIPDNMSKECQQHGQLGEATLHPDDWDCAGCKWKPEEETK